MTNTNQVRKITSLEATLLRRIATQNLSGIRPPKSKIARDYPWQSNRTVTYRYRLIDGLIRAGYVTNNPGNNGAKNRYHLIVTSYGLDMLENCDA